MAIPRFYCPTELARGPQIWLSEAAAHHAIRVLRLKPGDSVTLFNGEGGEYEASINLAAREGVLVDIGAYRSTERESPLAVCLGQSICAGEKMDYVLQKSVELGVKRIQPLATERSIVRLTGERAQRREKHWRNVVISACEQCGRNAVPPIAETLGLPEWLSVKQSTELRLILSPEAKTTLAEFDKPRGDVVLLAGPEAGFSPTEQQVATAAGFVAVRLGPRILRTETAPLAALAVLQAYWGDFRS